MTNPVIEELERKTLNCTKPSWAKRAAAEIQRLEQQRDEILAALDRLTFAAECRDNTAGDAARLIEVKAELAAAAEQARAVIAKVK